METLQDNVAAMRSVMFPNGQADITNGGTRIRNLCGDKLSKLESEQLLTAVKALTFIAKDQSPERIKASITMRGAGKLSMGEVDSIYRLISNHADESLYSGGDGSSEDRAVIINCSDSSTGVPAEYRYLEEHFGKKGKDWSLGMQMQMESNGRQFDNLTIEFPSGTSKVVYFDITAFFGNQMNGQDGYPGKSDVLPLADRAPNPEGSETGSEKSQMTSVSATIFALCHGKITESESEQLAASVMYLFKVGKAPTPYQVKARIAMGSGWKLTLAERDAVCEFTSRLPGCGEAEGTAQCHEPEQAHRSGPWASKEERFKALSSFFDAATEDIASRRRMERPADAVVRIPVSGIQQEQKEAKERMLRATGVAALLERVHAKAEAEKIKTKNPRPARFQREKRREREKAKEIRRIAKVRRKQAKLRLRARRRRHRWKTWRQPEFRSFLLSTAIVCGCSTVILAAGSNTDLPIGYYDVMLWAVCPSLGFCGYLAWKRDKRGLAVILWFLAGIYNPIERVRFEKETWGIVNLITVSVALLFWLRSDARALLRRSRMRRWAWGALLAIVLASSGLLLSLQNYCTPTSTSTLSTYYRSTRRMPAPRRRRPRPPMRRPARR